MPRASDVWFVYLLRCGDGTLYTGIARDVDARLNAHLRGTGARYTRGRAPLTLEATARCRSQGDALRLELAIKALSRDQKTALIAKPRALANFSRRLRRKVSP
ncbi:MAG: hypothetical protein NVS3B20_05280 [Polyangiales bacterium]